MSNVTLKGLAYVMSQSEEVNELLYNFETKAAELEDKLSKIIDFNRYELSHIIGALDELPLGKKLEAMRLYTELLKADAEVLLLQKLMD